jgi:hypothetical protein
MIWMLSFTKVNIRVAEARQTSRHWTLTTLREKLIKIGARVVRHSRKIVFQMGKWWFRESCSRPFWKGLGG